MSFYRHLAAAAALSVAALPLDAQSSPAPGSSGRGWGSQLSLTTDVELDDNVFLLSDGRKARVVSGAPMGSRYANMASAGDVITTVRGELAFSGPGLAGKRLRIAPEAGYELYARNAGRRSAVYAVSLAQRLGKGEQLRATASIRPSRFHKNYLLDAIDDDGSGSITPDERVYSPADQAETTIEGDYTFDLDRRFYTGVGAALRVGGGWYSRGHDAAFSARDLSGPTLGGRLLLKLTRATDLDVAYSYASLGATRARSVVILDEPAFGRDFNGNGTATDLAARAVEMVDHSRREQEIAAALGHDFGALGLGLELARRTRRYGSTEPYDLDHNGRRDARREIGVTMRYALARGVRLRGAIRHAEQTLNRAGADAVTGDVADYSRLRTSLGLEYRF